MDIAKLTEISFFPSLYDYIERLSLDPEAGALEFCRGGSQRLHYLMRAPYRWRREGEERWRLEIDARAVHNAYTDALELTLPPRVARCRVERGPFRIRCDIVWKLKDMSEWPYIEFPFRLRFDGHPLSGRRERGDLPVDGYEELGYPAALGVRLTAAEVRARGRTRGLLLLHERSVDADAPPDAPQHSFALCPDRMGGSLAHRVRRQLEGDFVQIAVALRGGERHTVDAAIDAMLKTDVDELVAVTLRPLPERRPPLVLAELADKLARRMPGVPLRRLPQAIARERVARHVAAQLRAYKLDGERASRVLLCAAPAGAEGATYGAAARELAAAVDAQLQASRCTAAFTRRSGCRPSVDEALAELGPVEPAVAIAWGSPLVPSARDLAEIFDAAQAYREAGGAWEMVLSLMGEHVAELIVEHVRAQL